MNPYPHTPAYVQICVVHGTNMTVRGVTRVVDNVTDTGFFEFLLDSSLMDGEFQSLSPTEP